jgi:uncharacterized protein (TIGR02145 family)
MNKYITAIFALAITFTFNACDSGGGGGGGNSSSSSISSSSGNSSSSSGEISSSSFDICGGFVDGTAKVHYGKSKPQFCDRRDGQKYVYVITGTGATAQTWMAENLNYKVAGSKCYGEGGMAMVLNADNNKYELIALASEEIQSNCDKYGRLYDWATAMNLDQSCNSQFVTDCGGQVDAKHQGICPSGWHVPNNSDWNKLFNFVDGISGSSGVYDSQWAGRYLKATSGWNSGGNGRDTHGFSALPGGYGDSGGSFSDVGRCGYWWSSNEYSPNEYYSGFAYIRYMCSYTEAAYWDYKVKGILRSVRCVKD